MAKDNTFVWIVVLVIAAVVAYNQGWLDTGGSEPEPDDGTTPKKDCNVEDVLLKYNDFDFYKKGTDPSALFYILDGSDVSPQSINDDGSLTVGVNSQVHGLAGENSTTYFSEVVDFNVDCMDPYDIPSDKVSLKKASAPTVTIVNDDGITKNADSSSGREDVAASNQYVAEFTVRSSAEECASRYGAILACEVDATYVQDVERESGDIEEASETIYWTHGSLNTAGSSGNATYDQWYTFEYPGELCDGDKDTFALKYTTTSTTPSVNSASLNCTWAAKDYDKDEDTLLEFGPAIFDEDNNEIELARVATGIYNT